MRFVQGVEFRSTLCKGAEFRSVLCTGGRVQESASLSSPPTYISRTELSFKLPLTELSFYSHQQRGAATYVVWRVQAADTILPRLGTSSAPSSAPTDMYRARWVLCKPLLW